MHRRDSANAGTVSGTIPMLSILRRVRDASDESTDTVFLLVPKYLKPVMFRSCRVLRDINVVARLAAAFGVRRTR